MQFNGTTPTPHKNQNGKMHTTWAFSVANLIILSMKT
jgi:hypothetical protein